MCPYIVEQEVEKRLNDVGRKRCERKHPSWTTSTS